jgi:WhiB family redox-sensing transcriptional regulator
MSDTPVRHTCGSWMLEGDVCRTCERAHGLCVMCGKNTAGPKTQYCSSTCKAAKHERGIGIPRETRHLFDREAGHWTEQAVCAQIDPEMFFPTNEMNNTRELSLALAACQDCPVRRPCLREGMQNDHGIWGGWTVVQRKALAEKVGELSTTEARGALIDSAADRGPRLLLNR